MFLVCTNWPQQKLKVCDMTPHPILAQIIACYVGHIVRFLKLKKGYIFPNYWYLPYQKSGRSMPYDPSHWYLMMDTLQDGALMAPEFLQNCHRAIGNIIIKYNNSFSISILWVWTISKSKQIIHYNNIITITFSLKHFIEKIISLAI